MSQQTKPSQLNRDLFDLICQIIELWGEGEAVEGERIAEIASNLRDYNREAVLNAIIDGLNSGRLKGKFYSP